MDLHKVIYEIADLDERGFDYKLVHKIFVEICKKCLLFAANLANSREKSEQEQQYQSDKMMEVARLCITKFLRFRWDKGHADIVMLLQMMLSNDLYASQENLEEDQLDAERTFWRFILSRFPFTSVHLFKMFLSIKS